MYSNLSKKILLITSFDSFLKAGVSVCQDIGYHHLDIKIRLTQHNQLSYNQIISILKGKKNYRLSYFYHNEINKLNFQEYDIIVLSIGNAFHRFLFNYLNVNDLRQYIFIISLFPGVIFGERESILARIQSNILLVNNLTDYYIADEIKNEYSLNTRIINYGLIQAKKYFRKITKQEIIYYIDQVIIPKKYEQRIYILDNLIKLANKNKDKQFFIKCRVQKKERTIHNNSFPLESLLDDLSEFEEIPKNLTFTYKPIEQCLEDASLILTVSSTVAIEAIYNDIPVAIVADFGVDKYLANKAFSDSGCFIKMDEIFRFDYQVNKIWYDEMVSFPPHREDFLKECIDFDLNNPRYTGKIEFDTVNVHKKSLKNKFKRYLKKQMIVLLFSLVLIKVRKAKKIVQAIKVDRDKLYKNLQSICK